MMAGGAGILVIGVGHEYRSDDGAGIAVARRLQARGKAGITILEQSGEGAALFEAWKEAVAVIVIDAVHSGGPPGKIHRLDARAAPVPSRFFHYSSHAFGVAEAIELARALNQLPPRLIVYGIEGKEFAAGVGLSAEVERAAAEVAGRVLAESRALMGEGDRAG